MKNESGNIIDYTHELINNKSKTSLSCLPVHVICVFLHFHRPPAACLISPTIGGRKGFRIHQNSVIYTLLLVSGLVGAREYTQNLSNIKYKPEWPESSCTISYSDIEHARTHTCTKERVKVQVVENIEDICRR